MRDEIFSRVEDCFNTPLPLKWPPAVTVRLGSLLFWGSANAIAAGRRTENIFECFDPVETVAASFGHKLLESGLCFRLLQQLENATKLCGDLLLGELEAVPVHPETE